MEDRMNIKEVINSGKVDFTGIEQSLTSVVFLKT